MELSDLMNAWPVLKVLVAGVFAFVFAASLTACGMTTSGGGLTMGSTSFLQEVNNGVRFKPNETAEWRK